MGGEATVRKPQRISAVAYLHRTGVLIGLRVERILVLQVQYFLTPSWLNLSTYEPVARGAILDLSFRIP